MRLTINFVRDAVFGSTAADVDAGDVGLIGEHDASFQAQITQMIFEATSIQLITGTRSVSLAAQFQPIFNPRIIARRKKEPQPQLGQLLIGNMLLQPQDLAEVMRGDFDG